MRPGARRPSEFGRDVSGHPGHRLDLRLGTVTLKVPPLHFNSAALLSHSGVLEHLTRAIPFPAPDEVCLKHVQMPFQSLSTRRLLIAASFAPFIAS